MQCRYLKNNYCEYYDEIIKEYTKREKIENYKYNGWFVNCFNCMVKRQGFSIFDLNHFVRAQVRHLVKRKGITPELMREFLEIENDREMLIRFIVKNSKWFNQNNIFVEKIFDGDDKCFIFHHEKDGENYYGNKNNIVLYENMKIIIEKFASVIIKKDVLYVYRNVDENNPDKIILMYDFNGEYLGRSFENIFNIKFGDKSFLILNDSEDISNDVFIKGYDENNINVITESCSYNNMKFFNFILHENRFHEDNEKLIQILFHNEEEDCFTIFIFDYNFNKYEISGHRIFVDDKFYNYEKILIIHNFDNNYKNIIGCHGQLELNLDQVIHMEEDIVKIKYKNKWWLVDFKKNLVCRKKLWKNWNNTIKKWFNDYNQLKEILESKI